MAEAALLGTLVATEPEKEVEFAMATGVTLVLFVEMEESRDRDCWTCLFRWFSNCLSWSWFCSNCSWETKLIVAVERGSSER